MVILLEEDKYSATLDSKADAWNVKYNPKDNCVGSSIDDTCALNGTKYVDFISEINNGKSIDDYDESDWLVVELTGKSDASELSTATSWYTATLINNIGIAFGDTNKTSIDEISKYVKKGQEIKFICTKGKISGYDCLLPIMYDKGDGTYLYEPGLSALDIEITNEN